MALVITELFVVDESNVMELKEKTLFSKNKLVLDLINARKLGADLVMYLKNGRWSQIFVNPAHSLERIMREIEYTDPDFIS